MSRRVRRIALALLVLVVVQEVALRVLFPLPELADLERTRYGTAAAARCGPGEARSARLRWSSTPDGAESVHVLNGYGFRDGEWRTAAAPGVRRVLFVGDSFVEGALGAQQDTVPRAYARAAGPDVEALNAGLVGIGLAEELRLLADLVPVFAPERVYLVLYANDLPTGEDGPPPVPLPEAGLEPRRFARWLPRIASLARLRARGEAVPRRFAAVRPFLPALGDPEHPWTDREERFTPFVDDGLEDALRAGGLNPFLTGLLAREELALRRPTDVRAPLAFARDLCARHGAELVVVYLPSRHQVTTHYVPFARALAANAPPNLDLTAEPYQLHRRTLAETCAALALPLVDLTDAIAAEERAGRRLYWRYDDHMRSEGYRFVGEELARRGAPVR